mmetsp:Transcript_19925/g.43311  ORF Transcript_19925/g.43311 Transcript_19925/m.43311 type:complete len:536 (+) Transcript_19925:43-1650(+)
MEKYAFVQKIGQGSFAVVWKARRKSDSRLVAVKQLRQSPESWDACKQLPEVRSAAAITDRRNIVQLLEAVRHGGELFLVFEHLDSSLHACSAVGQRVDESQVRWAARRLLSGLAAIHAAGLVHCDVKPENILVGGDASQGNELTLKLCDFGQAAPPEQIGTYVGTRWYRPPELLLDSRGDQSVDLWSAGCVIAELFLRRPLFPGTDTRDMLFRICGELGTPDAAWPLAAKLIEVSGRPNASAQAWGSLHASGASEAGVDLVASLLRYSPLERLRSDRAKRDSPFLALGPEVPLSLPPARPISPETLRRSREEATNVERKLRSSSKSSGADIPPTAPPVAPMARVPSGGDDVTNLPLSARMNGAPAPRQVTTRMNRAAMPNMGIPPRASSPAGSLISGSAVSAAASPASGQPPLPSAKGLVTAGSESPGYGTSPAVVRAAARSRVGDEGRHQRPGLPRGRSPSQGAGSEVGAGDSDDEALAEAFWGACKAGRVTPATSQTPDQLSDDDVPGSAYVSDISNRASNSRRSRRPAPPPA